MATLTWLDFDAHNTATGENVRAFSVNHPQAGRIVVIKGIVPAYDDAMRGMGFSRTRDGSFVLPAKNLNPRQLQQQVFPMLRGKRVELSDIDLTDQFVASQAPAEAKPQSNPALTFLISHTQGTDTQGLARYVGPLPSTLSPSLWAYLEENAQASVQLNGQTHYRGTYEGRHFLVQRRQHILGGTERVVLHWADSEDLLPDLEANSQAPAIFRLSDQVGAQLAEVGTLYGAQVGTETAQVFTPERDIGQATAQHLVNSSDTFEGALVMAELANARTLVLADQAFDTGICVSRLTDILGGDETNAILIDLASEHWIQAPEDMENPAGSPDARLDGRALSQLPGMQVTAQARGFSSLSYYQQEPFAEQAHISPFVTETGVGLNVRALSNAPVSEQSRQVVVNQNRVPEGYQVAYGTGEREGQLSLVNLDTAEAITRDDDPWFGNLSDAVGAFELPENQDASNEQIEQALGDAFSATAAQAEPFEGVVYRGEHGEPEQAPFQNRAGSISFGTPEVAQVYASDPNDAADQPHTPRIIKANIRIDRPLVNNPDDPFVDFAVLSRAVGQARAQQLAISTQGHIKGTNNWAEVTQKYGIDHEAPIQELLTRFPDALNELYVDAYPVLDDPAVVGWLVEAGFDGAIHGGNGESALTPEYKIFSAEQAEILSVTPLNVAVANQASVSAEAEAEPEPEQTEQERTLAHGEQVFNQLINGESETQVDDEIGKVWSARLTLGKEDVEALGQYLDAQGATATTARNMTRYTLGEDLTEHEFSLWPGTGAAQLKTTEHAVFDPAVVTAAFEQALANINEPGEQALRLEGQEREPYLSEHRGAIIEAIGQISRLSQYVERAGEQGQGLLQGDMVDLIELEDPAISEVLENTLPDDVTLQIVSIEADQRARADSAVANAEAYQARLSDRLEQIEAADNIEQVDAILLEHGQDPDGHLEGFDRVERQAKSRKAAIENPPEPGIVANSTSERQLQGMIESLTRDNPGKSYRMESRMGGFGAYYVAIDNTLNPVNPEQGQALDQDQETAPAAASPNTPSDDNAQVSALTAVYGSATLEDAGITVLQRENDKAVQYNDNIVGTLASDAELTRPAVLAAILSHPITNEAGQPGPGLYAGTLLANENSGDIGAGHWLYGLDPQFRDRMTQVGRSLKAAGLVAVDPAETRFSTDDLSVNVRTEITHLGNTSKIGTVTWNVGGARIVDDFTRTPAELGQAIEQAVGTARQIHADVQLSTDAMPLTENIEDWPRASNVYAIEALTSRDDLESLIFAGHTIEVHQTQYRIRPTAHGWTVQSTDMDRQPRYTSATGGAGPRGGWSRAQALESLVQSIDYHPHFATLREAPATGPVFTDIRPASENMATVLSSQYDKGRVLGDATVNIDRLLGGISVAADDFERAQALADAMRSDDAYIERIIVDEDYNVVEGVHRLAALQIIGATQVPVTRIGDHRAGMPINAMRDAIMDASDLGHPDEVNQLIDNAIDLIDEIDTDGLEQTLANNEFPADYEAAYMAALQTARPGPFAQLQTAEQSAAEQEPAVEAEPAAQRQPELIPDVAGMSHKPRLIIEAIANPKQFVVSGPALASEDVQSRLEALGGKYIKKYAGYRFNNQFEADVRRWITFATESQQVSFEDQMRTPVALRVGERLPGADGGLGPKIEGISWRDNYGIRVELLVSSNAIITHIQTDTLEGVEQRQRINVTNKADLINEYVPREHRIDVARDLRVYDWEPPARVITPMALDIDTAIPYAPNPDDPAEHHTVANIRWNREHGLHVEMSMFDGGHNEATQITFLSNIEREYGIEITNKADLINQYVPEEHRAEAANTEGVEGWTPQETTITPMALNVGSLIARSTADDLAVERVLWNERHGLHVELAEANAEDGELAVITFLQNIEREHGIEITNKADLIRQYVPIEHQNAVARQEGIEDWVPVERPALRAVNTTDAPEAGQAQTDPAQSRFIRGTRAKAIGQNAQNETVYALRSGLRVTVDEGGNLHDESPEVTPDGQFITPDARHERFKTRLEQSAEAIQNGGGNVVSLLGVPASEEPTFTIEDGENVQERLESIGLTEDVLTAYDSAYANLRAHNERAEQNTDQAPEGNDRSIFTRRRLEQELAKASDTIMGSVRASGYQPAPGLLDAITKAFNERHEAEQTFDLLANVDYVSTEVALEMTREQAQSLMPAWVHQRMIPLAGLPAPRALLTAKVYGTAEEIEQITRAVERQDNEAIAALANTFDEKYENTRALVELPDVIQVTSQMIEEYEGASPIPVENARSRRDTLYTDLALAQYDIDIIEVTEADKAVVRTSASAWDDAIALAERHGISADAGRLFAERVRETMKAESAQEYLDSEEVEVGQQAAQSLGSLMPTDFVMQVEADRVGAGRIVIPWGADQIVIGFPEKTDTGYQVAYHYNGGRFNSQKNLNHYQAFDTLPSAGLVAQTAKAFISAHEVAGVNLNKVPAYGSKFDQEGADRYDTTAIAKKVRQDIKAAIKAGDLPEGVKVSVRKDSANAINVTIREVPDGFEIISPEYVRWHQGDQHERSPERFTPEANALDDALEGYLNAYNFDNSDPQTDYHNTNYYSRCEYDWSLTDTALEQAQAQPLDELEARNEVYPLLTLNTALAADNLAAHGFIVIEGRNEPLILDELGHSGNEIINPHTGLSVGNLEGVNPKWIAAVNMVTNAYTAMGQNPYRDLTQEAERDEAPAQPVEAATEHQEPALSVETSPVGTDRQALLNSRLSVCDEAGVKPAPIPSLVTGGSHYFGTKELANGQWSAMLATTTVAGDQVGATISATHYASEREAILALAKAFDAYATPAFEHHQGPGMVDTITVQSYLERISGYEHESALLTDDMRKTAAEGALAMLAYHDALIDARAAHASDSHIVSRETLTLPAVAGVARTGQLTLAQTISGHFLIGANIDLENGHSLRFEPTIENGAYPTREAAIVGFASTMHAANEQAAERYVEALTEASLALFERQYGQGAAQSEIDTLRQTLSESIENRLATAKQSPQQVNEALLKLWLGAVGMEQAQESTAQGLQATIEPGALEEVGRLHVIERQVSANSAPSWLIDISRYSPETIAFLSAQARLAGGTTGDGRLTFSSEEALNSFSQSTALEYTLETLALNEPEVDVSNAAEIIPAATVKALKQQGLVQTEEPSTWVVSTEDGGYVRINLYRGLNENNVDVHVQYARIEDSQTPVRTEKHLPEQDITIDAQALVDLVDDHLSTLEAGACVRPSETAQPPGHTTVSPDLACATLLSAGLNIAQDENTQTWSVNGETYTHRNAIQMLGGAYSKVPGVKPRYIFRENPLYRLASLLNRTQNTQLPTQEAVEGYILTITHDTNDNQFVVRAHKHEGDENESVILSRHTSLRHARSEPARLAITPEVIDQAFEKAGFAPAQALEVETATEAAKDAAPEQEQSAGARALDGLKERLEGDGLLSSKIEFVDATAPQQQPTQAEQDETQNHNPAQTPKENDNAHTDRETAGTAREHDAGRDSAGDPQRQPTVGSGTIQGSADGVAAKRGAGSGQEAGRDRHATAPAARRQVDGDGREHDTGAENAPSNERADGRLLGASREHPLFNLADAAPTDTPTPEANAEATLAALQTLNTLRADKRAPTEEEKVTLARMVGLGAGHFNTGGGAAVFTQFGGHYGPSARTTNAAIYREIEKFTPEEQKSLKETVLTAFYTPATLRDFMWDALQRMGVNGDLNSLDMVEPAAGTGHFIGGAPEFVRHGAKIQAIECDPITADITAALYPEAQVLSKPFQNVLFPANSKDLFIGNPPYSDVRTHNPNTGKREVIHDLFLRESIKATRPGGIVAFVTSSGTMDKKNDELRSFVATRADLVDAVRLPNTAFSAEAGTEVMTDILFFRKRKPHEKPMSASWIKSVEQSFEYDDETVALPVNQFFVDNPHKVLGQLQAASGRFGPRLVCEPTGELQAQLDEQLSQIPEAVFDPAKSVDATPRRTQARDSQEVEDSELQALLDQHRVGSLYVDDAGDIRTIRYDGSDAKYFTDKVAIKKGDQALVKAYVGLRDAAKTLINEEAQGVSDEREAYIKHLRAELNETYDEFVTTFGPINNPNSIKALRVDPDVFFVSALEHYDKDTNTAEKADLLKQRVVQAEAQTSIQTPSDAIYASMSKLGHIDPEWVSEQLGREWSEVEQELDEQVFFDPVEGHYTIASVYLAGDVIEKREAAERALSQNPELERNIQALNKARPKAIPITDIHIKLGATWMPDDLVQEFSRGLMKAHGTYADRLRVEFSDLTKDWKIYFTDTLKRDREQENTFEYGTKSVPFHKILELSLAQARPKVFMDAPDNRRVEDTVATQAARDKQVLVEERFRSWLLEDPERAKRAQDAYNYRMNRFVRPNPDGKYLTFPGLAAEFKGKPFKFGDHQLGAIERGLTSPYGLMLAHEAGGGKTISSACIAIKQKQLGISNKPMLAVPNHMLVQYTKEVLDVYPNARILTVTPEDMTKEGRAMFAQKCRLNNWDLVVCTHSQFVRMKMPSEYIEADIHRQVDELDQALKESDDRITTKTLQRRLKNLEEKLKNTTESALSNQDDIDFTELGIDFVGYDEGHYLKNMDMPTRNASVAGASAPDSQRSTDARMKFDWLRETRGDERGVLLATGTPISNTVGEIMVMLKLVAPSLLERAGIYNYDNFLATFGHIQAHVEVTVDGSGYHTKERLSGFRNIPELMRLFTMIADIKMGDDLNLVRPKVNRVVHETEMSPEARLFMDHLTERAVAVKDKKVTPDQDNMLKIYSDLRKMSVDPRLFHHKLQDDPNSKVNNLVREVYKAWEEGKDEKATQLMFLDVIRNSERVISGHNEKTGKPKYKTIEHFNLYKDIRQKLVDMGMPKKEIAFIHDYKTDEEKESLFEAMREGSVRFTLATTEKMGVGSNVQTLLKHLWHGSYPMRSTDMEQRNKRAERQGNSFDEICVHYPVAIDSGDLPALQMLDRKEKMTRQIMACDFENMARSFDEDYEPTYEELMAITTGNPIIKEKLETDTLVQTLMRRQRAHNDDCFRARGQAHRLRHNTIPELREALNDAQALKDSMQAHDGGAYMVVGGQALEKSGLVGAEVHRQWAKMSPFETHKKIGECDGLPLFINLTKEHGALLTVECPGNNISVPITDKLSVFPARLKTLIKGRAESVPEIQGRIKTSTEQAKTMEAHAQKPFDEADGLEKASARQAELTKEIAKFEEEKAKEPKRADGLHPFEALIMRLDGEEVAPDHKALSEADIERALEEQPLDNEQEAEKNQTMSLL